jgi:hypothetical protein
MNRAPVAPLASVALLVLALVVACGTTTPTSTGPVLPTSALGGSGGATDAPGTVGPPPSPSQPDDATPVALEPELLAFLPESIDGIPVAEDLDVSAQALLDPALAQIATGVDAAVAVDTGTGNLVTAWVVRLRQGRSATRPTASGAIRTTRAPAPPREASSGEPRPTSADGTPT